MDRDAFDTIMASLDAPVAIVTTAAGDERAGCLIGFHSQASIHPRRHAIWLSKANHTYRVSLMATHLALHFLTNGDRDLAELFGTHSGDDIDKFASCGWQPSDVGPPLLTRCEHRLLLKRMTVLDDGSDHVCLVGEPVASTTAGSFDPLRLSDVDDLVAGHTVDERPLPPTERATD
ncbi:MAG: flavin reductase [Acidimicrobiia bacterium]|nr:flavin reductase [Acidimicrobiia bacterium]